MRPITKIIHTLFEYTNQWLKEASNDKIKETLNSISLEGIPFQGIEKSSKELLRGVSDAGIEPHVGLFFDKEPVTLQRVEEFIKDEKAILSAWRITINKKTLIESLSSPEGDFLYVFFHTNNAFQNWLESIEPLSAKFSIHKKNPLRVLIWNLNKNFGGQNFQFLNPKDDSILFEKPRYSLPQSEKIKEEVHVMANNVEIAPTHFHVREFSGNENIDFILRKNYLLSLSASLVQEFYNKEKVVIKGYKRIELPLLSNKDSFPIELISGLEEAVHWVYEERTTTRAQLLSDRLSLEMEPNSSLLKILETHLHDALIQAKEQYKFVILDRKDAYYSEKRSLLNELRSHSKTYSEKLRSLLNGLVRDVLAAIFLVGFGLFSKTDMTKLPDLLGNKYVLLLFKGLGGYFAISFLLQLIINLTDIRIGRKELNYWMETTRNYLSEHEVKSMIDSSTSRRRWNFRGNYFLIGLVYLGIVLFCWNLRKVFEWFI